MSNGLYLLLFLMGASALAAWAYVRLARVAPRDLRMAILHAVSATVACQVVSPIVGTMVNGGNHPELRLVFVIAVALPALTYELLSFIWLIALIQATIRRGTLS